MPKFVLDRGPGKRVMAEAKVLPRAGDEITLGETIIPSEIMQVEKVSFSLAGRDGITVYCRPAEGILSAPGAVCPKVNLICEGRIIHGLALSTPPPIGARIEVVSYDETTVWCYEVLGVLLTTSFAEYPEYRVLVRKIEEDEADKVYKDFFGKEG